MNNTTPNLPCPDRVTWCTDHYSNGNPEDEHHRHLITPAGNDQLLAEITQDAIEDARPVLSWHADNDSESVGGLLEVLAVFSAAAARFDGIQAGVTARQ